MFPVEALRFLRDLKENNEREWFQPRKAEYERLLKEPMQALVGTLNTALEHAGFADYVTDPQKAVYRVYRDTRFSRNKTPYKTHAGALLWHRKLGKDGGAGLYFQLSTEDLMMASGLYMAPPEIMLPVRMHIAEHYQDLERIVKARKVKALFPKGVEGDKLTRPPKGWTAEHPAVEWLKFKNLVLETSLPPETALQADAAALIGKHLVAMVPFLEFLNAPLMAAAARRKRDPLMMG